MGEQRISAGANRVHWGLADAVTAGVDDSEIWEIASSDRKFCLTRSVGLLAGQDARAGRQVIDPTGRVLRNTISVRIGL
jgi:hypothetical protein